MPLYIPETFYPQTTTTIETKQLRDSGHKSMANLGCPALVTCSKYPLIVSTGQTLELQGIQKRHAILKTAEPEKKNSPPMADPRYSARAHPSASPGSSGISAWHVATRWAIAPCRSCCPGASRAPGSLGPGHGQLGHLTQLLNVAELLKLLSYLVRNTNTNIIRSCYQLYNVLHSYLLRYIS